MSTTVVMTSDTSNISIYNNVLNVTVIINLLWSMETTMSLSQVVAETIIAFSNLASRFYVF